MRCPKCNYISFDRRYNCGKCGTDVASVAEKLQGTGLNVQAPFFLASALGVAAAVEPEPAPIFVEEEAGFGLGELETDVLPEGPAFGGVGADLDLAGSPLEEEAAATPAPQPLGLDEIDVSDLVPPQAEELSGLSLDIEEEGPGLSAPAPLPEEPAQALVEGLELPSLDDEELLGPGAAREDERGAFGEEEAGSGEEEIVDLSALMDLGEESPPAEAEASADEGVEFVLSLDDDASKPAPEEKPVDIFDLGLTMEGEEKD